MSSRQAKQKEKLNYTSSLKKRASIIVTGYCRLKVRIQLTFVLMKIIIGYFYESDYRRYKLIDVMNVSQYLAKDKDYVITKCLTLQNWKNYIQFHFLDPSSFKSPIIICFNLFCGHSCPSTYDVYYETPTTIAGFIDKQIPVCARKPKFNGELFKISIQLFNIKGQEDEHILQIVIMDEWSTYFQIVAAISVVLPTNVRNSTLYLDWKNWNPFKKEGKPIQPSFENGTLLIESYPKGCGKQDNSREPIVFSGLVWKDFDYDHCFKAYDE